MTDRPVVIAVCGSGKESPTLNAQAEEVGRLIAAASAVLVCGGLDGVMAAAARGAAQAGGFTVGVLPGPDRAAANPWLTLALPTGMGEGRNLLVVRFAAAVIAIGGEWGTLSEIALATRIGVPVVLLDPSPVAARLGLPVAPDPAAAVNLALLLARKAGDP